MKLTKAIIEKTKKYAKPIYAKSDGFHMWDHIAFVIYHAKYIARKEGMDVNVAEMGALLHDIARMDVPLNSDDHATPSAKKAEKFLKKLKLDQDIIDNILDTVEHHSRDKILKAKTKEAWAVYEADKLDCIGPRGYSRVIGWDARYKYPKGSFEKIQKSAMKAINKRIKRMKTKTSKTLTKEYLQKMKVFLKEYERIAKKCR